MRHIQRFTTAVVLILVLATPAEAASRKSSRSLGIVKGWQRFVILVMSRISPPGSAPDLAQNEATITPTDDTVQPPPQP
ncbi:MAG TPA: hypothetical protein VFP80_07660 [Thermoanaerobaculia bacterium]|nr:hypothetical protein [Thermoanaerobaculia bacterium]